MMPMKINSQKEYYCFKQKIKNPRWKVEMAEDGRQVKVTKIKTGKIYILAFEEFVYGQGMYNQVTERFPNYIHRQVWTMRNKL